MKKTKSPLCICFKGAIYHAAKSEGTMFFFWEYLYIST